MPMELNVENPIIEDAFLYYLVNQAIAFDEGDPIVPSEEVQAYLDKTEAFTSALVYKMNARRMDPELVDIIENFLYLNDERKKDGSAERRMLGYHTRVVARLRSDFPGEDEDTMVEEAVNVFVALNFNKPSLVEYYQRKIPVWVAIGEAANPHAKLHDDDDAIAFHPRKETIESIRNLTFLVKAKAYDEQSRSLKDAIKASVEMPV